MKHVQSSVAWWRTLLQWPVFLAANLAILLLVGISTVRETYQGWTVEREIGALEAQAQNLEDRKLKLVELTNSLSQPERIEYEARSRLGWKKSGERVVVLSGWQVSSSFSGDVLGRSAESPEPPPTSNPIRWIQFFFSPTNNTSQL